MRLHLQLNLERLGPAYQVGKPYYSLAIAAAVEPESGETLDTATVQKFLCPWTWQRIANLAVYAKPDDGSTVWTKVTPTPKALSEAPPVNLSKLTAALDEEITEQVKTFNPTDFIWKPNHTTPVETKKLTTEDKPRVRRDWRSFLSHLSTYPGGLGIHVNLSVFFHLDTEMDDQIVLAAPHLQFSSGPEVQPGDPNVAGILQQVFKKDKNELYRWVYGSHPDLSIDAYVNRPKPNVENTGGSINLETLWRNKPETNPQLNWLAQLDDALVPAFSLPDRFIEYLHSLKENPVSDQPRPQYRRALFESVKAAFDSGRVPPQGNSILSTVLFRVAKAGDFDFSLLQTMPTDWASDVKEASGTSQAYALLLAEHLSRFSSDANLLETLIARWKSAYRGSKWDDVEKEVRRILSDRSLMHYLGLHNVGTVWRALFPNTETAIGQELKQIEDRLNKKVVEFAKGCLDTVPADLKTILMNQVTKAIAGASEQLTADPTSDGLTIQLDKVDAFSKESDDDHADLLRQIAGAGVLLRRVGTREWRCLNMVQVQVRDKESPADLATPLPAPLRFQYSAGVRQPFVTYQNQPLVAKSPWADMAPSRQETNLTTYHLNALFRYTSPYGVEPLKLSRLTYGAEYEVAVYYFGTAGNLPREISEGFDTADAKPWKFRFPSTNGNGPQGVDKLACLRNCDVGAMRLEADPLKFNVVFPPVLPEGVHSLARVLTKEDDSDAGILDKKISPKDPVFILLPSDAAARSEVWDLAKGSSSAFFRIRPPSLDAKVWERWQPDNEPDHRKAVLGQTFTLLNEQVLGRNVKEDPSLDDPAVARFKVAFEAIFPTATVVQPTNEFDFGPPRGSSGRLKEQHIGRSIELRSTTDAQPSVSDTNGVVVLKIPDGQVWRVKFVPVIPQASRFAPLVKLDKPTQIYAEVAAPLFSAANQDVLNETVHKRISITPASGQLPLEDKLTVTLELDAALGGVSHLLHSTELMVQRWRWDGRPVYEDPTSAAPQSGLPFDNLSEPPVDFPADGMLFADRDDSDHMVVPGFVDFSVPGQALNRVHEVRLTGMQGVLYYRFGLRVYSRYLGLQRSEHFLDSGRTKGSGFRRWRRHIVPLRWHERVSRPAVKLLIPLTEAVASETSKSHAPGWLVLLDEPWYLERMAGLGGYLESRIDRVSLPDNASDERAQFGPDPILDMSPDPYADTEISCPRPVGALGFTFDTDASAPLFVKSSFVQPAPVVTDINKNLAFHFVKLRFRRVLVGSDTAKPRSTSILESEWTDPFWVQVLPPANRWRVKLKDVEGPRWVDASELKLGPKISGLMVGSSEVENVFQTSEDTQFLGFRLYGLLTRQVFDAFGRVDQEALQSFVPLGALKPPVGVPSEGFASLRLRIVEVQFRINVAGEDVTLENGKPIPEDHLLLMEAVFPEYQDVSASRPPTRDSQGRIVRVSPPIQIA